MNKVAFVTGGSSGIGLAIAGALSADGYRVYTCSRRKEGAGSAEHIAADITNPADVERCIKTIAQRENQLDLVVNCAGFGISGAAECVDAEEAKRLFDTDFMGCVRVNNAAIPLLRKSRGRIIHISSVAAVAAIPFQAYYSAAKAAVNVYTMALANELRPFGIQVCAVMPGDIRTGFTAAREKQHKGDDLYGGRIARSVAVMERDEENGMDPARIGRFVARVAGKRRTKPLYTVGFFYKCAVMLIRLLPCRLVNWILRLMYDR